MKQQIRFSDSESKLLYDAYCKGRFTIKRVLKDCRRSLVQEIEISGVSYILKIPREKNERKWQRFLSIFRGGESFREYSALLRGAAADLSVPKPVLAMEMRSGPFVIDSLLIMEFIEGRTAGIEDILAVSALLDKIHGAGLLHGDAQLANFIVKADKLYTVDCSLRKNLTGSFSIKKEFIYLEQSCGITIDAYQKEGLAYLLAKFLDNLFRIKLRWKHRRRLKREATCE